MLNKLSQTVHSILIHVLGRDRLEYFASNTTNEVTKNLDPFIWSYNCKAKIVAIRQETPDTKTFVLLPNQHFKNPVAGQHIEITLNDSSFSVPVSRCYTLSEIYKDTVSITVKDNPEGKVSNWLHKHAEVGMVFDISSARGAFVYGQQDDVLFICAGSGITPAHAMIADLAKQPNSPKVSLFYRTQTPENTIFSASLPKLNTNARIELSYSRDSSQAESVSMVDQLAAAFPDINQQSIYLCGPESFRNAVIQYLESIAYDMNKLEIEMFSLPSNIQQTRKLDEDVSVRFTSRNINFVIPAGDCNKTILEAAEEQGIQMEHGCRSGMCGSCKTNLISGEVSGNQIGNSIYPCTAYPASTQLVLD